MVEGPSDVYICGQCTDLCQNIFKQEKRRVSSKRQLFQTIPTPREIKEFLDDLPGMQPYISAHVRLVVFGAHAIPVDEKLANLLRSEGAIHPDSSIDEITHFLERQFKAGEGLEVHVKLQAWVDAGSKRISTGKVTKKTVAKKKGEA